VELLEVLVPLAGGVIRAVEAADGGDMGPNNSDISDAVGKNGAEMEVCGTASLGKSTAVTFEAGASEVEGV